MKRERNSSGYAAMHCDELVECLYGISITQHDGDLSTFGDVHGLALGTSLCGFHSRHQQFFSVEPAHVIRTVIRKRLCRPPRESRAIFADDEGSIIFSSDRNRREKLGNLFGSFDFHGVIRGEQIPPMSEHYSVTSDNARFIYV